MKLSRRGLLRGLLAAPAIVRTPGLLMPIRVAQPIHRYLGLPQLKQEGTMIIFDPADDYLAMRLRFRDMILAGLLEIRGEYADLVTHSS